MPPDSWGLLLINYRTAEWNIVDSCILGDRMKSWLKLKGFRRKRRYEESAQVQRLIRGYYGPVRGIHFSTSEIICIGVKSNLFRHKRKTLFFFWKGYMCGSGAVNWWHGKIGEGKWERSNTVHEMGIRDTYSRWWGIPELRRYNMWDYERFYVELTIVLQKVIHCRKRSLAYRREEDSWYNFPGMTDRQVLGCEKKRSPSFWTPAPNVVWKTC